jgi:hypothetical protein
VQPVSSATESTLQSILIVSFYFPPYPKVGARRWAKFAKYLVRAGYPVRVLAATMDVDKESPWDADAAQIEDKVTRLRFQYKVPYFKRTYPRSPGTKVRWHLSRYVSKLAGHLGAGNPADRTEIYAKDFLMNCEKIISRYRITTLIFTASPNHLSYHISTLKKKYPHIKFIFDLRDYWTDWLNHLPPRQYRFEQMMEAETISNADIILSPAKKIIETLQNRYHLKKDSMHVISHAYDPDDFELRGETVPKNKDGVVRLVYAGTLYPELDNEMRLLVEVLKKYPEIKVTFYSFTKDYAAIFDSVRNQVEYKSPVGLHLFNKIALSEYSGLLYLRGSKDNDRHFFSTKFYDYLPLRLPVVYLGPAGDVSEFIERNKIGFHLISVNQDLSVLIVESSMKIKKFQTEKYSFSQVAKALTDIIEN